MFCKLWPYQAEIVDRAEREIVAESRRALFVLPTGDGKTLVAGALVANAVERGDRALFLAHSREITAQTSKKLFAAGVSDHAILQAGFPMRPSAPVPVASIQTLHPRAVVIVDEAHHAPTRTYQRLIESHSGAAVIGLTVTPCRSDGQDLGNLLQRLLECPSVADLIAARYLVGTRVYAPSRPDLSGVSVQRGDYVEAQFAIRMDRPSLVGDIVQHWHRLADRRPTVVFGTGVPQLVHLRDEFRLSGVLAEHFNSSTPTQERDEILAKLATGPVEFVCNSMVLIEVWDQPEISCIVLAEAALERQRPECDAVLPIAAPGCPECGFIFVAPVSQEEPRPRAPETRPGALERVTAQEALFQRLRTMSYRKRLHWADADESRLELVRRANGYKRGWVWHARQAALEMQGR